MGPIDALACAYSELSASFGDIAIAIVGAVIILFGVSFLLGLMMR